MQFQQQIEQQAFQDELYDESLCDPLPQTLI